MGNVEVKTTVVNNQLEQILALDYGAGSDSLNFVLLAPGESGIPSLDTVEARLLEGQPIMATILNQVVEIIPKPQMVKDFFSRPHQQGIQHGPYLPIPGQDLEAHYSH